MLEYTLENRVYQLFTSDLNMEHPNILAEEPMCFSAARFYYARFLQPKIERVGIHALSGHTSGPIAIDSGGYQNLRAIIRAERARENGEEVKDVKKFTVPEMVKVYRMCHLQSRDCCVALDEPPTPDLPTARQHNLIRQTNSNFEATLSLAPDLDPYLVPVTHGWDSEGIDLSLNVARGRKMVAIGAFFPLLMLQFDASVIQKLQMIQQKTVRNRDFEGTRFWALGANGASGLHLCAFAGWEVTDSSAWRQKAANYKIVFNPLNTDHTYRKDGLAEVSTTGLNQSFKTKWTDIHDRWLSLCECPVCAGRSLAERKQVLSAGKTEGWLNRCCHNASAYLGEKVVANDLAGTRRYRPYLEKRFQKNYRLRNLLHAIEESRNQIDEATHYFRDTSRQSTLDQYHQRTAG